MPKISPKYSNENKHEKHFGCKNVNIFWVVNFFGYKNF